MSGRSGTLSIIQRLLSFRSHSTYDCIVTASSPLPPHDMAHATVGMFLTDKVNRLQELDLAVTGTQSSSLSCDTVPLGDVVYQRRPFDRSSSVCSTAGTLTRSMAHAQGTQLAAPQQTMRATSQGSKVRADDADGCVCSIEAASCARGDGTTSEVTNFDFCFLQRSLDVTAEEEDTPTKRAKVRSLPPLQLVK